jgi:hypothetical protein
MKGNREVVVVTKEISELPDRRERAEAVGAPTAELASILADHGASMKPLFPPAALPPNAAAVESVSPELSKIMAEQSRYYLVEVDDAQAESLVKKLKEQGAVETAYIKPAVENPLGPPESLENSFRLRLQ